MSRGDFLKRQAKTPLRERFLTAGLVCEVSTNSELVLRVTRESFLPVSDPQFPTELRLRFWVDPSADAGPPWPKPYFRGLDHMVYTALDPANFLLMDLLGRRAIGRLTPAMAADQSTWKRVIFPAVLGVLGAAAGVTVLHCGCAALDGQGLLLAGASGSGKSSLVLALAQIGFAYLADDRTFISDRDGRLLAWGLPTPLKLREDCTRYFPELEGLEPVVTAKGERAFEVDPGLVFEIRRSRYCEPRWLVFLERQAEPGFRLTEWSPARAAARLESEIFAEAPEVSQRQRDAIAKLLTKPCWRLCYGGEPHVSARALARFIGES